MPTTRRGTVVSDVVGAIEGLEGKLEWKGDREGCIRVGIARVRPFSIARCPSSVVRRPSSVVRCPLCRVPQLTDEHGFAPTTIGPLSCLGSRGECQGIPEECVCGYSGEGRYDCSPVDKELGAKA